MSQIKTFKKKIISFHLVKKKNIIFLFINNYAPHHQFVKKCISLVLLLVILRQANAINTQ